MAAQPHERLYRGLPPVVHQRWRRGLIAGAVGAVVAAIAAVVVLEVHHSPAPVAPGAVDRRGPGVLVPPFDRNSLLWIAGAFIVGGALAVAVARGWWSMVAVDALGFAAAVALAVWVFDPSSIGPSVYGWFFWVFGASAGAGLRRRIHRSQPA